MRLNARVLSVEIKGTAVFVRTNVSGPIYVGAYVCTKDEPSVIANDWWQTHEMVLDLRASEVGSISNYLASGFEDIWKYIPVNNGA